MQDRKVKILLRNFAIELVVYALLLIAYFYLALRFLGDPLKALFDNNMVVYAILALGLIVGQAVLLDWLTGLIIRLLGLERLD